MSKTACKHHVYPEQGCRVCELEAVLTECRRYFYQRPGNWEGQLYQLIDGVLPAVSTELAQSPASIDSTERRWRDLEVLGLRNPIIHAGLHTLRAGVTRERALIEMVINLTEAVERMTSKTLALAQDAPLAPLCGKTSKDS
jgi:hypothetical protein